jgi:tRNA A-37 threonylcarbamoyl transferase component Bud32
VDEGDALLGVDTCVDNFRICGFIGEGAMGQVYLAQDVTLGRRVALKLIKRSVMARYGTARFLEEARATASLNHPHIVILHAVGEHDGRPYLALEFIDGESLRTRLRGGPLPLREALRCGQAVAEAIAEAHRHGIIHTDLKPDNIVIPCDGRLRVVDFGLAKLAGDAPQAASGTPAYMAPERWRGAPPTGAMDIWALGVTLHELIVGSRLMADDAIPLLAFATELPELASLPDAPWAQLVRDCLALDPAARPTAEAVVRRISVLLAPRAATPGAVRSRAAHPPVSCDDLGPWPLHPASGALLETVTGARDAAEFRQEAALWLARHIGAEAVLFAPIPGLARGTAGLVGVPPAWLGRLADGFTRYSADFAHMAAVSRRWRGFFRERDTELEGWAHRHGSSGFHEELVFPFGIFLGTAATLEVRQAEVGAVLVGRERSSRRFTDRECDLLNGILPILAMGEAVHGAPAPGSASPPQRTVFHASSCSTLNTVETRSAASGRSARPTVPVAAPRAARSPLGVP